ncbi:MAG TPA: response regulator [Woeseiaceae bacterium]|nr:response regulator [Woeseiaceae bacterium]
MTGDDTLHRILYVEDDADIRKIVSMSLEMVGSYTVASCGSCAEALQVVDDFGPELLLLDVMMPDVDGPATLRELRKRTSAENAPAVFITAKVQAGDMAQYRRLGVYDVIVKPFDPMVLPERVGQIWQQYRSGAYDHAG